MSPNNSLFTIKTSKHTITIHHMPLLVPDSVPDSTFRVRPPSARRRLAIGFGPGLLMAEKRPGTVDSPERGVEPGVCPSGGEERKAQSTV